MAMTAQARRDLCRNPPPEVERHCVPGMRCEPEGHETERVRVVRDHRMLVPVRLGQHWYLLPRGCDCQGLAKALACEGGPGPLPLVEACALHDLLVEKGVPVPPPVLAVMRLALSTRDKRDLVRAMLEVPTPSNGARPGLPLSNREIARRCGCSEGYVRRIRAGLSAYRTQIDTPIVVRRGQSTYTMRRRVSR